MLYFQCYVHLHNYYAQQWGLQISTYYVVQYLQCFFLLRTISIFVRIIKLRRVISLVSKKHTVSGRHSREMNSMLQ